MATLKTNTLTGTSTAGSIAVTGEGNSTTTNLQQGLLKAFIKADFKDESTIRDSFNTASVTDVGTGDQTWNITNAVANKLEGICAGVTARTAINNVSGISGFTLVSTTECDINTCKSGGDSENSDLGDAEWDYMLAGSLA